MLPALLILAAAVKPIVLVIPPAPRGDAPEWASFGLAETITDLYSQQPDATWVALKQLDSVLRRRDLRLNEAADPWIALPLARTLGATDVIVGDLRHVGEKYYFTAQRVTVATKKNARSFRAEGGESDLPQMAVNAAKQLLDISGAPMEANGPAFAAASRCGLGLVRHPLRPQAGAPSALEDAAHVEADCKAAAAADPALGYAHAGLSLLASLRGDKNEALAELQRVPKGRFVAQASLAAYYSARKFNDEPGARAALEEAVKERPGFLHALGYLAEDRMEQLDYKAGLAAWQRYLQRAPNHPFAIGQLGHAQARLGRNNESLASTRRALDLDPNDAELLIELASRQIDANQDREAEATLRQALEIYPPRPLARLRLGFVYLRQKRAADAHDTLTEAVTDAWREDEAKTRGLAFADLARAAGLQNNLEEAVQYLNASKAEGAPVKLPCDAAELKGFVGKAQFDAVCKQ